MGAETVFPQYSLDIGQIANESVLVFSPDSPPDYDLIKQGFKGTRYREPQWAMGPDKSPLVVGKEEMKGGLTSYEIWIAGELEPIPISVDVSQGQDLLGQLKASPVTGKLNFHGYDSLSTMQIKIPRILPLGENGTSANLTVSGVQPCLVLIGFKQQEFGPVVY